MNTLVAWITGLAVSVALHAGLLIVLPRAFSPEPVANQPIPQSEMRVETQAVARSESNAVAPSGDWAPVSSWTGTNMAQGEIRQSRVAAAAIETTAFTPVVPDRENNLVSLAPPQALASSRPPSAESISAEPQSTPMIAAVATPEATLTAAATKPSLSATLPAPLAVSAAAPQVATLTASPVSEEVARETQPTVPALPSAVPVGIAVAEVDRSDPAINAAAPQTSALPQADVDADTVLEGVPESTRITAELAFMGEGDIAIDPQALATIQSFMQPGDPGSAAAQARDALEALLSQIPCSRLQAEFDPDRGTLALRGHIPEEAMRAPVLAALQAQVGQGIVVTDAMLILPRPQCGALAGIGAVGLPQSTDQVTNRRIVGADAHARVFDYRGGDSLVLEMQAPDYDAYVYVDYFDAAGNVIHLVPNDIVPLTLHPAQSTMVVGRAADGQPALEITIAPPYGQEIAVAFAASAPLYDQLRPTVEDAGPYLEWLALRVAEMRAADEAFKGEWVYFFVATREE